MSISNLMFRLHPKDLYVPETVINRNVLPVRKSLGVSFYNKCITSRFKAVTHCLFDLDGTILDSELRYHKLLEEICRRYGKKYTRELKKRLYGSTDREICAAVIRELQLKLTVEQLERELYNIADQFLPKCPLRKGVERLIYHLHENNIPMALATNSTAHTLRLHIKAKPKIFGMFHHMVTFQDPEVDRGKPHPDIYIVAASRFDENPKPSRCLVFEDSPIGVEAAIQAGMQVVMLPCHNVRHVGPDTARKATLILPSLYDFKPEYFGLPPFKDDYPRKTRKYNILSTSTSI